MIDLIVSNLAPEVATPNEMDAIRDALPEVFYQGLLGLVGSVAVQPWTTLTIHTHKPEAFKNYVGPTLGHLAITYLSWHNSTPIITTNFDTFFESAAYALGLSPVVYVPSPTTKWKIASMNSSEVSVWKVHGSADKPESICTTLEKISTVNLPLISRLKDLFGQYRPCLLGYSGRDIDIFPFITSFPFRDNLPAFWVCKEFPYTHGIFAHPERFIGIQKDIDEFAIAILASLDDESPVANRLRSAVKRTITASTLPGVRENALQVYLNAARGVVSEQILPVLMNKDGDDRLLLHAISLANVQQFILSAKHAEGYTNNRVAYSKPLYEAKAWNLLSSCYHNLAKYKRSEIAARRAHNVARLSGHMHEAIYALANVDEALRMQLDLDLLLNARPFWGKVKNIFLALRFLLDLFKMEAWANSINDRNDPSYQSISSVIIEHRIRLFGIIQGLLIKLSTRRVADLLLAKKWKHIQDESYRTGYAAGIGNALKFLKRVQKYDKNNLTMSGAAEIDVVTAQQVYNLIGHRTGLALIMRDKADSLANGGRFEEAALFYKEVAEMVQKTGNSSLELKALLGLHSCGLPIDTHRVYLLAGQVENDAQHKIAAAIRKKLVSS